MSHTPGPWKVDRDGDLPWMILAYFDGDIPWGMVAEVPVFTGCEDEAEANARLIAAAPETKKQRDEMLAVLRAVRASIADSLAAFAVPVNDSLSDALDAIDATINDATMKEEA